MPETPQILLQESDFLIVAKPSDLISHPTRPDGKPSLLGWLQTQFPGEFIALANRLDRETSGTVLVARSPEVASKLGTLTMRREVQKYYLALVAGEVISPHGEIDAPIGRLGISPENPIWVRQGVIASDDPEQRKSASARSEYWTRAARSQASLLRLQAHTGRLHQLRVHLAHLGHPVLGDKIYGPDSGLYLRFIEEGWTPDHQRILGLRNHALHAHEIRFRWNEREVACRAPLPDPLREAMLEHFPAETLDGL